MYKKGFCEQYHVGDSVTIAVSEESQVEQKDPKGVQRQKPLIFWECVLDGRLPKKGAQQVKMVQKHLLVAQNEVWGR